jgi:predicted DNA-binding protein
MSHLDISTTPQIQFPLRLSHELTKRLNQTAKSTRINKTTLGRIAIKSLLDSIEERGITKVLNDVTE